MVQQDAQYQQTNGASTEDWLKATDGMVISVLVEGESRTSAGTSTDADFTSQDFDSALRTVSQRVKPSEPDSA